MSCPREGKECNEYMCGNMIDGICGGNPKESDYDRAYQQGRADAIDEILSICHNSVNVQEVMLELIQIKKREGTL